MRTRNKKLEIDLTEPDEGEVDEEKKKEIWTKVATKQR